MTAPLIWRYTRIDLFRTIIIVVNPHSLRKAQNTAYCYLCSVICLSISLCDTSMSPEKTDKPIEIPFVLWTRVGPRNHVISGDLDPPGEGAIFGDREQVPLY